MNILIIISTVAITFVLAFWFFDKFEITDRFIAILSATFGMVSMLSLVKQREKVMKYALVVLIISLLVFLAFFVLQTSPKKEFQSPFNVEPHISQRFKPSHYGLDLVLPVGTPLYPIREGTVIRVIPCPKCDLVQESLNNCGGQPAVFRDPQWNYGYGRTVVVKHENPFNDGKNYLYSLYAHLERINVSEGDNANLRTVIGYSGNSGCSTGSHLHLELRSGNVLDTRGVWLQQTALDPAKILEWKYDE